MTERERRKKSLLRDASFIPVATQACDEIHQLTRQLARFAISSPRFGPETYVADNAHVGYTLRGIQRTLNIIAAQLPIDSDVGYLVRSMADQFMLLRAALSDGVCKTVPETDDMQQLASQMYFGDLLTAAQAKMLIDAISGLISEQKSAPQQQKQITNRVSNEKQA